MAENTAPEFRIGQVLGKSLSVYFRNIISFSLISLIVTAPSLFFGLQVVSADPLLSWNPTILKGLSTLFGLALPFIAAAMLAYGTVQDLRGKRATFSECFVRGVKLLFPVLGVAAVAVLMTIAGLLFLIIPGLVIMTIYWVAIPAAVVERKGVAFSLNRSNDLTEGYQWRVFAILVVLWLVEFAAGSLYGLGLRFSMGVPEMVQNNSLGVVLAWIDHALLVIFTSIRAVAMGVGYFTLRMVKEGVDIEEIARVFD